MTLVEIRKELDGSILDIGGGGEGIIGRVYGRQVTAIDKYQEELDEAPDCFTKLQMDATSLDFSNESFDNVTFFYSLMYMSREEQQKSIAEAWRVLEAGGRCEVWDAVIEKAYPEPFLANLEIEADEERISVTYGIVKNDAQQNAASLTAMFLHSGFTQLLMETTGDAIRLSFLK